VKRKNGRLITIGSFDGIHRGHAELLNWTVREARKRHVKSLALTFNIPPRMVLQSAHPLSILSTQSEKETLIKSHQIDDVLFLDFDKKFSSLSPFHFFKHLLLQTYNAKGIVVGSDFRFGVNRSAGVMELVRWGLEYEIPVWVVPPVRWKKTIVSSTTIRSLFDEGKIKSALDFLGHSYLIHGKVVKGRGIGRKIGFPTLNVQVPPGKLLPRGVYAVKGRGIGSQKGFFGVCNIGTRPTFKKKSSLTMEVHVLKGLVGGKPTHLEVEILGFIRLEKKFPTIGALQKQIRSDITRANALFR
jgi:riboflavin kinase / FMN adenylyltransferase